MLRIFKIIFEKAMEAIIKLIGVITLAFSFLLSSSGKKNDGMDISSSETINHSITFDISHLESTQYDDTVELYFKSSASIIISQINIKVGKFRDILPGDSETKFKEGQWYMMGGYEGVEVGQKWTITFYGIEALSNTKFITTTNYVVNQQ